MNRILGIGNALVDIMTLIESDDILKQFALPKGSMQLVDSERSASIKAGTSYMKRSLAPGGSAANTIFGVAMLGAPSGFIGSIGKDETGDFFEDDFKRAGVRTNLFRRDTPTGTAVALISPDSERTFATHLGAAVELEADDLKLSDFKDYDILYLEGYLMYNRDLVERACRYAKVNNMKVALDLASYNVVLERLNDFREVVSEYVDIIFANAEEAKAFTGLEPDEALAKLAEVSETAIVKVGADGSWIKRGDEHVKLGALPVMCVDTTGAGDLYAAGFLYGMANNESLEKCGLYGATLAGKVIEIIGARLSADKWEEIKKIISGIPED